MVFFQIFVSNWNVDQRQQSVHIDKEPQETQTEPVSFLPDMPSLRPSYPRGWASTHYKKPNDRLQMGSLGFTKAI